MGKKRQTQKMGDRTGIGKSKKMEINTNAYFGLISRRQLNNANPKTQRKLRKMAKNRE